MGFTPEEYTYKLTFSGTELDGLIMSTTSCTVGEWQDMLRMSSSDDPTRTTAQLADNNDRIANLFLDNVKSWNLEIPAGKPVPISLDGFRAVSNRHGGMMITAWQKSMSEVPTNSPSESSDGALSPEQSLGLASELEDLPNWKPPTSS